MDERRSFRRPTTRAKLAETRTLQSGSPKMGPTREWQCPIESPKVAPGRSAKTAETHQNSSWPKRSLARSSEHQDARFTKPIEFWSCLRNTAVDRRIVYVVISRTPPPANADVATLLACFEECDENDCFKKWMVLAFHLTKRDQTGQVRPFHRTRFAADFLALLLLARSFLVASAGASFFWPDRRPTPTQARRTGPPDHS